MRNRERAHYNSFFYLIFAPALLVTLFLTAYPMATIFYDSFFRYSLVSNTRTFVGFQNFSRILREELFQRSLVNTLVFTLVASITEVVLGTALAFLFKREFRGKRVASLIVIFPMIISTMVICAVWQTFYHYEIGIFNYILRKWNLAPVGWLTDQRVALFSIILVDIWQWTPMITIIVLAGLAGLSTEPYESAMVDGANSRQVLFRITLPMLMPTILTAVILRAIDALKTYDIIYSMTRGGPGYTSENLNVLAFKYSFEYFRMGQSAIMLVFLFIIVMAFSLLVMRLRRIFEM